MVAFTWLTRLAYGDTEDHFDGGIPRFVMGANDAQAQIVRQEIDLRGGRFGTPAERLGILANQGTYVEVVYPLSPSAVIDEFSLRLWLRAERPLGPCGIRVRFPHQIDPTNNEPISSVVFGDSYRNVREWQELQVKDLVRLVNLRQVALRAQYGANIDLRHPYIDAVVLNVYQQPGLNTVWIDDLEVFGQVPRARVARQSDDTSLGSPNSRSAKIATPSSGTAGAAFDVNDLQNGELPPNLLLRILQYRGEPMSWLKAIGVDAILMERFPSESELELASQARMMLICPPPPYPIPSLQDQVSPIIAWYLSDAVTLTEMNVVAERARVARQFPASWQRPLVMTVLEGWREAAMVSDYFVRDLPSPLRDVTLTEMVSLVSSSKNALSRPQPILLGIDTEAPPGLNDQLSEIANAIGAPLPGSFGWHSLWARTASTLVTVPRGYLFRSQKALDSGDPADHQRALALRFVCHWLKALEPIVSGATPGTAMKVNLPTYFLNTLACPGLQVAVCVSQFPRAGDGQELQITVPEKLRGSTILRLSGPTPELLRVSATAQGEKLSIVSPDLVEVILFAEHPEIASRFSDRWNTFLRPAFTDRWQLTYEELAGIRDAWQTVSLFPLLNAELPGADLPGSPGRNIPMPLMVSAANALTDAQGAMQSNDWERATSLIRRADVFQLAARSRFYEQMRPPGPGYVSLPTLMSPGGLHLHLSWLPALGSGNWEPSVLAGSEFADPYSFENNGWRYDRRLTDMAQATIEFIQGTNPDGSPAGGALRVRSWPLPGYTLRGGYEGTTLRICSPVISGLSEKWIRIDAQVRSPVGFSGPEEGLLIYDSIGGAELGKLVRGGPNSQYIRLYRYVPSNRRLQICLESLGAGEAIIERIGVEYWNDRRNSLPSEIPR